MPLNYWQNSPKQHNTKLAENLISYQAKCVSSGGFWWQKNVLSMCSIHIPLDLLWWTELQSSSYIQIHLTWILDSLWNKN